MRPFSVQLSDTHLAKALARHNTEHILRETAPLLLNGHADVVMTALKSQVDEYTGLDELLIRSLWRQGVMNDTLTVCDWLESRYPNEVQLEMKSTVNFERMLRSSKALTGLIHYGLLTNQSLNNETLAAVIARWNIQSLKRNAKENTQATVTLMQLYHRASPAQMLEAFELGLNNMHYYRLKNDTTSYSKYKESQLFPSMASNIEKTTHATEYALLALAKQNYALLRCILEKLPETTQSACMLLFENVPAPSATLKKAYDAWVLKGKPIPEKEHWHVMLDLMAPTRFAHERAKQLHTILYPEVVPTPALELPLDFNNDYV